MGAVGQYCVRLRGLIEATSDRSKWLLPGSRLRCRAGSSKSDEAFIDWLVLTFGQKFQGCYWPELQCVETQLPALARASDVWTLEPHANS